MRLKLAFMVVLLAVFVSMSGAVSATVDECSYIPNNMPKCSDGCYYPYDYNLKCFKDAKDAGIIGNCIHFGPGYCAL